MFSKILVGTDGSETAEKAVARAAELAARHGAELLVLHAHGPRGEEDGKRILEEVEAAHGSKVKVRGLVQQGVPADVIIDVAQDEGADLVVVGNKGMMGVTRLLGSVPNKVSHHSPSHLLIVKTT